MKTTTDSDWLWFIFLFVHALRPTNTVIKRLEATLKSNVFGFMGPVRWCSPPKLTTFFGKY